MSRASRAAPTARPALLLGRLRLAVEQAPRRRARRRDERVEGRQATSVAASYVARGWSDPE